MDSNISFGLNGRISRILDPVICVFSLEVLILPLVSTQNQLAHPLKFQYIQIVCG